MICGRIVSKGMVTGVCTFIFSGRKVSEGVVLGAIS